jgi:hypothetical protein
MTLTQAVVSYVIVFFVLLIGMGIALWRYKVSRPKLPRLKVINVHWLGKFQGWCKVFDNEKQNLANGEFWLKVLLSTFIALCSGVSLVTIIFPYETGWMMIGLFGSLILLAALLQYLLA